MNWSAVAGQSYTVWVSTNLTSWTTLASVIAQGANGSYTDSVPVMSQRTRFFRVSTP
jgi:hypothetical protein